MIIVNVNSTIFDIVPQRMQPGKTVFLTIKDTQQIDYEIPVKTFDIKVFFFKVLAIAG